jgi:hypothetical protein
MSITHSSSTALSGLVLAFDMNNIKSYRGPAMQNLANAIGYGGIGIGTGYSSTALTETIDIPKVGPTTVFTNIIQNNYTVYTPTNNNCCPSLHGWGGISVSPSTLYTYSILYRCESGYTSANYMYRYEYTSNGGSYVTEGGVFNDANRIDLGGGWYYAWGTFTTQSTTNWLGHCGTFYYRYSNLPDKLSIAKVMIVAGNYSGLHPKYWPDTNTTRSSTQAVLDLTGRRSITVSGNPTYGSDGSFTFNSAGSTTLNLGSGANFLPMPSLTLESWIKTPGLGSGMSVNGVWGFTYGIRFNVASNGVVYFIIGTDTTTFVNITTSGVNVNDNNWHHIVAVKNGDSSCAIYVDGIVRASGVPVAGWSGTNPWFAMDIQVGRDQNDAPYYFNGKIDIGRVYNRGLTAEEVQQNFNALRGRYGI